MPHCSSSFGYLIGSIPVGVLVGRIYRGVDVRDYGSGKIGFTNTLRSLGWGAALIVAVGDTMKGVVPILIGRFVFDDPWAVALGGVAAVAGHMFPLFAGFRGGRGAATAFGAVRRDRSHRRTGADCLRRGRVGGDALRLADDGDRHGRRDASRSSRWSSPDGCPRTTCCSPSR